jgi:hypothetical protein
MSRAVWIAIFLGIIALGLGAAAVTAVVTQDGGSGTTTTSPSASASVSGPFELPLGVKSGTLALAKHRQDLLVGIAAQPGGPLEVAAVRAETPLAGGALRIAVDGRALGAQPCGRGCSRVQAPVLDGRPTLVTVRAGSSLMSFRLPRSLPASGERALDRARRTMGALRSYRFTERLSSGQGVVFTRLNVQAPDRLSLRTNSGYRSVIIGRTRWEFLDGRWERGPFPGLAVREVLMWYEAKNPRILRRLANGDVELTAYGLKPVPAWFRLTVEPSGRVVKAEMTAPSHFMLHRYSAFDHGVAIEPPQ